MRRHHLLALAVLPLALVACSTTSKYEKDPMYDAGFSDGCATGTARAQGAPPSAATRDELEWKNSDAYRAGWKSGYASCNTGGSRSDSMGHDRDPTRRP